MQVCDLSHSPTDEGVILITPELVADIGDGGERVVGLHHDLNYYSHLSVYRFGVPYLQGKRVLDAGCGTGYGTGYLVDNGASSATGADYSEKAVQFAKENFSGADRDFIVANLGETFPFQDAEFDAIFSSQAMEHIGQIEVFFSECCRVLKPDGVMVFSVPAIMNREGLRSLEENIWNIYHVTNLTPLGWYSKASRYFDKVAPYHHWLSPQHKAETWEQLMTYFNLSAGDNKLNEADFAYTPMPIDEMNSLPLNLNAVFVLECPRRIALPHTVEEFIPPEWAEGEMSARIRREYGQCILREVEEEKRRFALAISKIQEDFEIERSRHSDEKSLFARKINASELAFRDVQHRLDAANVELENMRRSTSWKLTSPIRALRRVI